SPTAASSEPCSPRSTRTKRCSRSPGSLRAARVTSKPRSASRAADARPICPVPPRMNALRAIARRYRFRDGKGIRLVARGTAEGGGRPDGALPPLRRRPPLVRGVRVGDPDRVPDLRRRDAAPLPEVRRGVLVDLRGRL